MKRPLLAAAVVVPVVVLAAVTAGPGQVIEVNNFSATSGSSYVNVAQCAGQALQLEWSALPNGTPAATDTFKIYASNTKWATSGTDANFCPEKPGGTGSSVIADLVDSKTAGTTTTDRMNVAASKVVSVAGADCTNASNNKVVYVCVHWYAQDQTTRKGFANGQFIIQLAAPAAPTGVSVGAGPGSLDVSWTPGAGGVVTADHFIAEATPVDDAGAPTGSTIFSDSVNGNEVTIDRLTDGQRYSVIVKAYSIGGNPSVASTPVFGTPTPVDDFWDVYTNTPGAEEQGGCGVGGAGPVALLGVAGLLAVLRRRK